MDPYQTAELTKPVTEQQSRFIQAPTGKPRFNSASQPAAIVQANPSQQKKGTLGTRSVDLVQPVHLKKIEEWFDFIIQSPANISESLVRNTMKRFGRKRERRATDVSKRVFNGFAAIHYAAYFGHETLLGYLLPYEFDLLTETAINASFPQDNRVISFRLASCSTIIHILAMAPNPLAMSKCVDRVLSHIQYDRTKDYQLLIGKQNSMGQNATHIALLRGQLDHWWKAQMVYRRELFQKTTDDLTTVMIACFMGRVEFMDFLCRMFTPIQKLSAELNEGFQAGQNVLDEVQRKHMQNKLLLQLCKLVETDGFNALHAIQDGFNVDIINGSSSMRSQCESWLKTILDYKCTDAERLIEQHKKAQKVRCCSCDTPEYVDDESLYNSYATITDPVGTMDAKSPGSSQLPQRSAVIDTVPMTPDNMQPQMQKQGSPLSQYAMTNMSAYAEEQ